MSGVRPAVWSDWSKRSGEDDAAKDAGESEPPRAGAHLHPARGTGSGGRRDDGAAERPGERLSARGPAGRGAAAERPHRQRNVRSRSPARLEAVCL